jgi:hypothetical protein
VAELSEPDAEFISDNFISNETSYLQVAKPLQEWSKPGGAYLGVGPEQNFTYIALTKPSRAYIVDIRRDNLVVQLMYKAIFDMAESRSHFLTLLTARPYDRSEAHAADADIEAVLAHADRKKATADSFDRMHGKLRWQIQKGYGIPLDMKDQRSLRRAHRAFFDGGLDIRFTLKEASFRKYPTLRELLSARCPEDDTRKGFLASEKSFRFLQRMQRENRIVPLVGNFAGDAALPALAKHLKDDELEVATFYVSNVEQYLLADGLWWKWQRNVAALPTGASSVFIRAYLDQGKPHPKQLPGHRSTNVLMKIADFKARKAPYPTMLALATDGTIE